MVTRRLFTAAAFVSVFLAAEGRAEETIDFNRDVRPLLSENCFLCHGPDEGERKAGLRLDLRDEAVAPRSGGAAIEPGNPEGSELIRRIRHADPEEKMPPPEAHKDLSPDEIEVLAGWISQGAPYAEHWAFVPPRAPELPAAAPAGGQHPIDRFVERKLREHGLEPSPPAKKETLIRRVSFDLTGLPPTPEEVEAFVRDETGEAYARVVDRLLSSEHYGERMALAWMDAARYGDTSVMHADGNRDMWPWRDWVIRAYNGNMPFDRFTVEQVAGDLLPDSTVSQRLASGFNRNHATSDEGGAIPEELRVEYVVDRVKTTSNVWMALTMECSQCHDHKYDPISQKDYYRFFAYFNNTSDPGMQTRNGNQAPVVTVLSEDRRRLRDEARGRAGDLRKEREAMRAPREATERWIASLRAGEAGGAIEFGDWKRLGPFQAPDAKTAFRKDFGPEKGVDLEKEQGGQTWEDAEPARNEDGKVHLLSVPDLHTQYFYRTIRSPGPRVIPLSLGSDDGIKLWLNGELLVQNDTHRIAAPDQERVNLRLNGGENRLLMKIVNINGGSGFYFGPGAGGLPTEILELVEIEPLDDLTPEQFAKVSDYHTAHIWPPGLELEQEIAAAEREAKEIDESAPTAMVMQDLTEKPRTTYVLNRGQYDQPIKDEEILPGVPETLGALPEGAPANRLGLARWLTRPDHPLTARVAVNRYWALLFGQGLVKTAGDFGNQGAWPSHPELLDWLAVDFVRHGWDVKRMVKQVVMSATYRQTSRVTPRLLEIDPDNRLLSRGPRFRLQGEFIRDNALAVSGLLVPAVGGPGVKPYQPDGIWNEVSLNGGLRYQRDKEDKLYRRSLYTYWKRSAPMPNMLIFDAPTREKCVVMRARTNTPLQAFVTLNDPQFVEAARVLAQRMLEEGGDTFAARVDFAFRLATARPVRDVETAVLEEIYRCQREAFAAEEEKATRYLSVGDAPRDSSIDPAELAAWTVVAQMILNLDEVLTRG